MDDLLSTIDVAALIGVSRQRAHQLVNRPDFPAPVATVNKRTKIWARGDVLAWVNANPYNITDAPSS